MMTAKEFQQEQNKESLAFFNCAIHEYGEEITTANCYSLFSCDARIYETTHFLLLQSFQTFVGCYNIQNGYMYNVQQFMYGKITKATSAQFHKFFKWLKSVGYNPDSICRYYKYKK